MEVVVVIEEVAACVAVVVDLVVVFAVGVAVGAVAIDNPSVDWSRFVGKLDPRGRPKSIFLSDENVLWSRFTRSKLWEGCCLRCRM
jgi:hypothetical protein